jgi:hypothetical protein
MDFISNCSAQEKIKSATRVFHTEPGSIIDIISGEYNQLLVWLTQTIIAQWNNKMCAKPIIVIGQDENSYLERHLREMSKTTRLELKELGKAQEDGGHTLEDTSVLPRGTSFLVLSIESVVGAPNDIAPIYDKCNKQGIIVIGDITPHVDMRARFTESCHIGFAQLSDGLNLFYMNKLVKDAIGYEHIYSDNIYMRVKLFQNGYLALDSNVIRRLSDNWAKIIKYINDKQDINIYQYSSYLRKSSPTCIILMSGKVNRVGLGMTFVRGGHVVPRLRILYELKKRVAKDEPVPYIRCCAALNDSYKANCVYFPLLYNIDVDPILWLIDQIYAMTDAASSSA